MQISNNRIRTIQRTMHLVASGYLLLYFYTPLGNDQIATMIIRGLVIPMLILTGLVMWQLPRLSKLLRGKQRVAKSENNPPQDKRYKTNNA